MLVVLDAATLGDADVTSLHQLSQELALPLQLYATTTHAQRQSRAASARLLVVNKVRIDAELLAQLPTLEAIFVLATGVNNIDVAAVAKRGIALYNCQDYAKAALSQHCFAMLLHLVNNIQALDQAVRHGAWSRSPHFSYLDLPISQLSGKTFTVVGYGGLGQATAALAKAFGMHICIAERPNADHIRPGRTEFHQALAQADVLSLHCPSHASNKHMLNAERLALLKPSAIVLNSARGDLIDEVALKAALLARRIAGAALDVLSVEPPPADHPLLDPQIPNLLITPHVAWAADHARAEVVNQLCANIRHFMTQVRPDLAMPLHSVDTDVAPATPLQRRTDDARRPYPRRLC